MHLAKKLALATLTLGLAAGPALAADPTGNWQSTTGESRYQVSYCGEGQQLCAKLTWLRDDAKSQETLPYLGGYVLQGAVPTAANRWKGALTYNGDVYNGSVTMVSANTLTLKGCDGIFCKSMQFVRL
jgi:uncharacterized protein (DUF2147 family)